MAPASMQLPRSQGGDIPITDIGGEVIDGANRAAGHVWNRRDRVMPSAVDLFGDLDRVAYGNVTVQAPRVVDAILFKGSLPCGVVASVIDHLLPQAREMIGRLRFPAKPAPRLCRACFRDLSLALRSEAHIWPLILRTHSTGKRHSTISSFCFAAGVQSTEI